MYILSENRLSVEVEAAEKMQPDNQIEDSNKTLYN